jgi:uncharacterized protein (DUF58 family)
VLGNHLIFVLVLFIIALIVRDDFIFTIVYLLAGATIISRLWTTRVLLGLRHERSFVPRAFCGEEIPVRLVVRNQGWLPVLWLRLSEGMPVEVAPPAPLRQVLSLGPRSQACFEYVLRARKRGYYHIGPLFAATGDLLGLVNEQRLESATDPLIIYPRIVHFKRLNLPSFSPLGHLRHTQPIYEDHSRVMGKRPYMKGDSLRRVDWKTSANTGSLQVKLYDPSISLTTAIFLDMDARDYDQHTWIDAIELAIIIAASISAWVIRHKQSVGLFTNGMDPLQSDGNLSKVMPRVGQTHLMRILELLARISPASGLSIVDLLQRERHQLPWGTTLILVSGKVDEPLFNQVFQARQAGFNVVLVLAGQVTGIRAIKERCTQFDIPLYHFRNELDLDQWRS